MNFIPHLCLKLAVKVNILGPLSAKRGRGVNCGNIMANCLGPRAAAGRAQLVVERPPEGADPFWTHSLLTIWENMLVQKHHIRLRVILHKPI